MADIHNIYFGLWERLLPADAEARNAIAAKMPGGTLPKSWPQIMKVVKTLKVAVSLVHFHPSDRFALPRMIPFVC